MKGARRLQPVSRNLTAPLNLSMVLDALSGPPFKPLPQLELRVLFLKTARCAHYAPMWTKQLVLGNQNSCLYHGLRRTLGSLLRNSGCHAGLWRLLPWPMRARGCDPRQGCALIPLMVSSWALFQDVSMEEICAAASWATPHTLKKLTLVL